MTPGGEATLGSPATADAELTLDEGVAGGGAGRPEPQHLGRFRLRRLLGRGGMGQVWEAWDPELERQVAIKRLLTADLAARRRFLREARLQATLVHPGICPVFEVGQHAGEPYLVMPCLDGLPLDQAVEGEPTEHMLDLVRQVAEAVHAAHRQGLVHRDLKPANILVEQPPEGPPRPLVLDFGIARSVDGERMTASGEIVGTPAYMAPEQVEGRGGQIDRRTDVYALGATLYRLLSGRPPHGGEGTPLLLSIVRDEPDRLPTGDVPVEVEAIVFKCLEKDKDKRYPSARALAEDLGRYLAGEPVEAQPVTRWIRLGKWMRRHRVAVRATVTAALVAVAALAWGGWSAWRSEERQETARRFGAQVEEIEALARYSHLLPIHDVRDDKAQLRARLEAIRPSLDDRDPVVRALAAHALGRGHLALDELETARDFLEKAYELAPQNGEIAADLGRALSELYRERLTHLERFRDRAARDSVREQLAQRLGSSLQAPGERQEQWQLASAEPARDLMTSGRTGQTANSVELDALILFHGGQPEVALERLADAPPGPAWAYERHRLEGDIRRSWGAVLAAGSGAEDKARLQLQLARQAYDRALQVAQSHAAMWRDDAQTIALLVQMGLTPVEEVDALIGEARRSLDKARAIDPRGLENWLWTARLEQAAAAHRLDLATDPRPALASALAAARQAIELDDDNSSAWFELGQIHVKLARWQRLRGADATESLELAQQALERVALGEREYHYFIQVGILHLTLAGSRAERGLEAAETYEAAIAAYRSAAELHSEPFSALSNLGLALFEAAGLDRTNANDMLRRAIEIFDQAHALRPDHMVPIYYLGHCRLRLSQGGDLARNIVDDALAEHAQADFEKAIELAPGRFAPWVGLGELLHLRAIAAQSRGHDPGPFFARARQAYERALELAPDHASVLLNLAWTVYFEGKLRLRGGGDGSVQLAEAEALCRRSLNARRSANSLLCLGSALRMQAEHRVERKEFGPAASLITEAEEAFEAILEIDSSHAEAHRSLGRLHTLEAQRLRLQGVDPTVALARARNLLDRSLELEDALIDFHLADARWYLEQARWFRTAGRETTDPVAAGLRSLAAGLDRTGGSREAASLEIELRNLAGS